MGTKIFLGFKCTEVIVGKQTLWVTSLLPFKGGLGIFSKYGAVLETIMQSEANKQLMVNVPSDGGQSIIKFYRCYDA